MRSAHTWKYVSVVCARCKYTNAHIYIHTAVSILGAQGGNSYRSRLFEIQTMQICRSFFVQPLAWVYFHNSIFFFLCTFRSTCCWWRRRGGGRRTTTFGSSSQRRWRTATTATWPNTKNTITTRLDANISQISLSQLVESAKSIGSKVNIVKSSRSATKNQVKLQSEPSLLV